MDIQTLERAADAVLAAPDQVSENDRKMAESLFHNLKNENYPLDHYIQAMRQTNHQFVLYEISQALAETVLRRWVMIEPEDIQAAYKNILEYVVNNETLLSYVVSDFLRTVAVMFKRGICDKKTGDTDELCQMIRQLITNDNTRIQSIGCQLISAITEQFSSAWRSAHLSITWDFHVTAKSEFEKQMLRVLFEMSLETLSLLCTQPDIIANAFYKNLCSRFLEVAETIVQWNFSARVFRRFFAYNTMSNSFRPPQSWFDLLSKNSFLDLFFQLHSLVRNEVDLALRSLSCLGQLASFSGEIMTTNTEFAQEYISKFIGNLVELFRAGPLPHEINGLCGIINRLFVFRPVTQIVRLEVNRRAEFFAFYYELMKYLIKEAMTKAIADNDHSDQASLVSLLDGWVIMLRGRWRVGLDQETQQLIEDGLLRNPTQDLVNTFILSVQAPPFGTRPTTTQEEEDDDDEDKDDREVYKDLLIPFGTMAEFTINSFIPSASHIIHSKVEELKTLMNGNNNDIVKLQNWQEDMHWIMLFVGHSVVSEDIDGSCSLAGEVFDASFELIQNRQREFDEDTKIAYLLQCIQNPAIDRPIQSEDLDPFIILLGEVLAWNSLEHQMIITDEMRQFVSPELTRSSILCLKRFINAASHIPDEYTDAKPPLLFPNDTLSDALVRFVMEKVFSILRCFSGEKKLCTDIVDLLTSLIDSRADYLSRGTQLYDFLCKIDITKLPSKTKLMKALVLIAAQVDDQTVQQRMYQQILLPLINQFQTLSAQPSDSIVDSDLADLLQCFNGVALAATTNTACALVAVYSEFLNPLMTHCVPLMNSRAHCQPVITAILQLMLDVTTKVIVYIEDNEKGSELYQALVEIVKRYAEYQKNRFISMTTVDEEEKAHDLVLFMEILSNVLSKDILETIPHTVSSGAQVVMMSLEMLLSIMNENILKIPDVATKFYRLLVYLVEFSAEALDSMSPELLQSIFQCIKLGISSSFGAEITSLACEALTEVALFMSRPYSEHPSSQIVQSNLHELLPISFEACLEYSSENSLFSEACSALYALICYDREFFENYIRNLLTHKNNEEAGIRLRDAFTELLPEELKPTRQARLDFRRRMEKLLSNIQGLLTLP